MFFLKCFYYLHESCGSAVNWHLRFSCHNNGTRESDTPPLHRRQDALVCPHYRKSPSRARETRHIVESTRQAAREGTPAVATVVPSGLAQSLTVGSTTISGTDSSVSVMLNGCVGVFFSPFFQRLVVPTNGTSDASIVVPSNGTVETTWSVYSTAAGRTQDDNNEVLF